MPVFVPPTLIALATFTVPVASVIPVESARIVVLPAPTPVIGTGTLVPPWITVTLAGTVATAGLSDLSVNVMPPTGAGAEMFNVVFVEVVKLMFVVAGLNVAVTVTFATRVAGAKPGANAVIVDVPMTTPVTCGFAAGVCWPAGMKTLAVTVATVGALLVKVTVVPPGGAGLGRLRARLCIWPGATAGIIPRLT
jgi:hypothetical protein